MCEKPCRNNNLHRLNQVCTTDLLLLCSCRSVIVTAGRIAYPFLFSVISASICLLWRPPHRPSGKATTTNSFHRRDVHQTSRSTRSRIGGNLQAQWECSQRATAEGYFLSSWVICCSPMDLIQRSDNLIYPRGILQRIVPLCHPKRLPMSTHSRRCSNCTSASLKTL